MLITVLLLFVLALALAWLMFFPSAAGGGIDAIDRSIARVGKRIRALRQQRPPPPQPRDLLAPRRVMAAFGDWTRDHGPLIGGAVAIALLPVALVLLFGENRQLSGFDDRVGAENRVATSLLQGEQLVPPPPLPPDVFVTREVERVRPHLGTADRDWSRLDPQFRQRLLTIYQAMAVEGYTMVLLEGYRSPDRQAFLQSQGENVTNAGAWQSYHQYGQAADSAFFRDGKLVISEKDPWALNGYQRYGELAEAAGLTWGGRWTLRDFGHIENRMPARSKK